MRELRRECWSKVKKGEMSARKEKWENAFSGKQLDSVRKEIPVVPTSGLFLIIKHNHPLPLLKRRLRLAEVSLLDFALRDE